MSSNEEKDITQQLMQELQGLRRDLKAQRSFQLAEAFLFTFPCILFLAERLSTDPNLAVPSIYFWSFVALGLVVLLIQWLKGRLECGRLYSLEYFPKKLTQDYYTIAVWEPRSLLTVLFLFESLFLCTGMMGQGMLGIKYSLIPCATAALASCIRGYIHSRKLSKRILQNYFNRYGSK